MVKPPYHPWRSPGFLAVLWLIAFALCLAFGWWDDFKRFVTVLWGWTQ